MVLSGMSDMTQVRDNISSLGDFTPLTEQDKSLLSDVVRIIYEDIAVGCTACRYCVDGCPKNIEIPKYFGLYNTAMQNKADPNPQIEYEALITQYGKASDCIGCKKCEKSCPQHIPIRTALKRVAATFEGKR